MKNIQNCYFPLYFLKRGFLAGLGLVLLSGFTLFALNGTFIQWELENGNTVDFIINPTGCDCDLTEQEITSTALVSMQQWNDVSGSFFQFANLADTSPELFIQDPSLASKKAEFDDGFNVISFSNEIPEGFAGFARFKLENHFIVEADVFLGAGLDYNLDMLQSLITHELGHTFGLGHDHADVASIMSYGRDAEETKLGADDIIGITTIYPKSGNEPQPDLGCASLIPFHQNGDPSPPFFDQALLNLLFLILLMWGTLAVVKRMPPSICRTPQILQSSILTIQNLWNGPPLGSFLLFLKGGGLGLVVLLVMVSCGKVMEEPTEDRRSLLKQQGFIMDLNQLEIRQQKVAEGHPEGGRSPHHSEEVSFYFGKRKEITEASSIEPRVQGNKVTFYCPQG